MAEKERHPARCAYESEEDNRRRVIPPVPSTFIAPALPHLLPFRPPHPPLSLSLSHLASQHTLSPIMPVSLRLLSSHSLCLPLPPNNPRSRCIQGRCYRQRTIQPSRHSPSLFLLLPHSACLSPFLSTCPSIALFRSPRWSVSVHPSFFLPTARPIYVSAYPLNLHTHQHRYATSVYVVQVKSPGTGRYG